MKQAYPWRSPSSFSVLPSIKLTACETYLIDEFPMGLCRSFHLLKACLQSSLEPRPQHCLQLFHRLVSWTDIRSPCKTDLSKSSLLWIAPPCIDQSSGCYDYALNNRCREPSVYQLCKRSCGQCPGKFDEWMRWQFPWIRAMSSSHLIRQLRRQNQLFDVIWKKVVSSCLLLLPQRMNFWHANIIR